MKFRVTALLALLALFSLLAACTQPAPPAPAATVAGPEPTAEPAQAGYQPIWESTACPFQTLPDPVTSPVECGYLVVPEKRSDPAGRTIRLAGAIFRHPEGASQPDPIIYLMGGPGGSILKTIAAAGFANQFGPIFDANRDLILFDQRGVGFSEPGLDCPAFKELYFDLLDFEVDGERVTSQERLARKVEALAACAEELSAVADLSAYNTVESAADVNDLRIALGYDQVNLWGGSYGSRLALGVLRDFPQGLRSVMLEAAYPPEADLYLETPASFDHALAGLAEDCAAEAACNAAYPDLRGVLVETIERLNENPAPVQVLHPLTRQRYDVLLDGDSFAEHIFRSLYETRLRPNMPQIIYNASVGTFDTLLQIISADLFRQEIRSWGMYLSVLCHEEIPFSSPAAFEAVLADYPEFAGFFQGFEVGGLSYAICPQWGAGQADAAENEPVTGVVPTLVLAGEYDPIAPSHWGLRVAENLQNGYFFEYPGGGHGVTSDCSLDVMLAFLDDPTTAPDASCVAAVEIPPFVAPLPAAEIELEPFTNEAKGFSGLAPVGWTEAGPSVFARANSPADQTALIHDVVPVGVEALVGVLAQQFGLDEPLESVGERQANSLAWTLYATEVQGVSIDIALAEQGETTLLVILQRPASEGDAFYESVFLPAVDALKPFP